MHCIARHACTTLYCHSCTVLPYSSYNILLDNSCTVLQCRLSLQYLFNIWIVHNNVLISSNLIFAYSPYTLSEWNLILLFTVSKILKSLFVLIDRTKRYRKRFTLLAFILFSSVYTFRTFRTEKLITYYTSILMSAIVGKKFLDVGSNAGNTKLNKRLRKILKISECMERN